MDRHSTLTRTAAPRVRLAALLGATAVALLTLSGCTRPTEPPTPAPSTPAPTEQLRPIDVTYGPRQPTTDLTAPWSIVFVGNSAIVSERDSGRLLELAEDGTARELVTLPNVVHGGEGGLLGLAISPASDRGAADADPGFLYAYSTGNGGNRVQRFEVRGEPGALSLGDATTVIEGLPSARSHNGGRMAFGPDGKLYITVGDAEQPELAQQLDSLAGKILRLNPDGTVPDDNPFAGSPIYSYGHRNPQGIAWGPDGTMYSSELGLDTWDELNVITAGANYGWPIVEGIGGDPRFVDPVQQWRPADASPSGMAIVNDTIYIANLRGQRLRAIPLSDLTSSTEYFVSEYGRIRDAVVSPDGRLWLLTNNTDGRVEPRAGDDRFIDTGLVDPGSAPATPGS